MSAEAVYTWRCDRCDASAPPNHRDERPDHWRGLGGRDVCGDCWTAFQKWWDSWQPTPEGFEEKAQAFFARVDANAPPAGVFESRARRDDPAIASLIRQGWTPPPEES